MSMGNFLSDEFREKQFDFLRTITECRTVDQDALDFMCSEVEKLTYRFKDVDSVSKTLLCDIYTVIETAKAQAPYCGDSAEALLSDIYRLQTLFGLILSDETPRDRMPGVPRII